MDNLVFSGLNTLISVLDAKRLKRDDFTSLLNAQSLHDALTLLSKSGYEFDVERVEKDKQFDQMISNHIQEIYRDLFEVIPDKNLLQVFTMRYTYHNLKVLLKQNFVNEDFEDLLIDVGPYSLKSLKTLVELGESSTLPRLMVEGVKEAKEYYESSKQAQSADIFMDTYYFKHLRLLADTYQKDYPKMAELILAMIDIENITTLLRGLRQNRSRSFLQTVLSNSGSVSKKELVDTGLNQPEEAILALFAGAPFSSALYQSFAKKNESDNLAVSLELLGDSVLASLLEDAAYEAFGPYPVLRFAHALEMEAKNVSLILVGLDNGFSKEQLEERMRPIYG